MLLPRVIPCLLLKGQGLVKGIQFKNHRYIGDPINAVQLFNTMEVDELLFLDILATKENRIPSIELVQKIADQCLMPFGIGGGIKTVAQIRDLLKAGAEKVCLNTYALENPELVHEASEIFGRQSIVVSVDIQKNKAGGHDVFTHCGTKLFSRDLKATIRLMEEKGAGEILLNSIDRDGTMGGYDLEVLKGITQDTAIPVIALGGAGSVNDLKAGIETEKASAVAAGSLFVFHGPRRAVLINYPTNEELKGIRGG